MHSQTIGQDGSYHIDDNGDNKFTVCLYLSNIDADHFQNISGDLFIKIPNEKVIVSIEPIDNRLIFFPSTYLHKGMAFNCLTSDIKRLCIAWKLEEIK